MDLNDADPRTAQPATESASVGAPTRRRATTTQGRARKVNTPAPRRHVVLRVCGSTLHACLVGLLIIAGLGGIAALRLSRGPISLGVFTTFIQSAVSAELGGNRFTISDAQLALGTDGLEISLTDIKITAPGGAVIAQAPEAVAVISGPAALTGQFGFSRIDLISPRLVLSYANDGTLSVTLTKPSGPPPKATDGASPTAAASTSQPNLVVPAAAADGSPLDFVKTLTDLSAEARRGGSATTFLHGFGLRQATLVVDNGHHKTVWHAPEINLDFRHKSSASLIGGHAVVDSPTGPWSLEFRTIEAATERQLVVLATVHGLNPRGLSGQIAALSNFNRVDVPFDGDIRLDLSSKGSITTATFDFKSRAGRILNASRDDASATTQAVSAAGAAVEPGVIKGNYDDAAGRISFSEVSVSVDHNRLDLTGNASRTQDPTGAGPRPWDFAFQSTAGILAPATPTGAPVAIDKFNLRGQIAPDAGQIVLQEIGLDAGGASITAQASVNDLATDASRSADLEAKFAPMPIDRLLALWPSAIAPRARAWLADHVTKGRLDGGTIKIASNGDNRLSLSLDIAAAEVGTARGLPPFLLPKAHIHYEAGGVDITIPDASIGGSKPLQFKATRISIVDPADGSPAVAEVAVHVSGPAATALELADRDPFRLLKSRGIVLHAADGRLDGQFKVTVPVSDDIQATDLKIEGQLKLVDGHLRQALGPHDITGAKASFDISESAVDARGDFLLKGIPIKFAGQYFLNSTPERQSPMRLAFKLDDADRSQLGLDINDLISGDVPVEVLVGPDAKGDVQVHVNADLTNAELTLESVSFRKPAGSAAQIQFDPVKGVNGRVELRDFKIAGKSIAAAGLIVIGPDGRAKELLFPEFSLNTVSRLQLESHLRPDNVWELHAKGATFDGRDLFRDLFTVDVQSKPVLKGKPGLDLIADIETVVGFSDTNLRDVHVRMSKRSINGLEKTSFLEIQATHENGKSFEAHIRSAATGQYKLTATSDDAGQIFKTVGFYPNAAGGRMTLEVDLDVRGAVERDGTLRVDNFTVFGDPVVSEVFLNGESSPPPRGAHKIVREKFDFDWMELPFAVGSGQFVMNDAEIRGPLVGARMRGKIDFHSQRLQVAGTYIPLSGLNSALGGLPILGQLLAGPKGEGVFGFTFLIQGPTSGPQVLVNPFSGLMPGLTRETAQMAPENFRIVPRPQQPKTPPPNAARASSASPSATGRSPTAAAPQPKPADVISDWTSENKAEPRTRSKPAEPQDAAR